MKLLSCLLIFMLTCTISQTQEHMPNKDPVGSSIKYKVSNKDYIKEVYTQTTYEALTTVNETPNKYVITITMSNYKRKGIANGQEIEFTNPENLYHAQVLDNRLITIEYDKHSHSFTDSLRGIAEEITKSQLQDDPQKAKQESRNNDIGFEIAVNYARLLGVIEDIRMLFLLSMGNKKICVLAVDGEQWEPSTVSMDGKMVEYKLENEKGKGRYSIYYRDDGEVRRFVTSLDMGMRRIEVEITEISE